MDEESLAAQELLKLSESEFKQLAARVAAYAVCRLRIQYKNTPIRALGSWREPTDIAHEAIKRCLCDRTWNKEEYPTLYDFLRSIVSSIIDHIFKSPKHSPVYGSEIPQSQFEKDGQPEVEKEMQGQSLLSRKAFSPSEQAEVNEAFELLKIEFYCSLNDVPEVQKVLELLLEDKDPREISSLLKIEINRVQAAQKMIKRRLRSFFNEKKLPPFDISVKKGGEEDAS